MIQRVASRRRWEGSVGFVMVWIRDKGTPFVGIGVEVAAVLRSNGQGQVLRLPLIGRLIRIQRESCDGAFGSCSFPIGPFALLEAHLAILTYDNSPHPRNPVTFMVKVDVTAGTKIKETSQRTLSEQ